MNNTFNWVIRHVKAVITCTILVLIVMGACVANNMFSIWSKKAIVTTFADDHRAETKNQSIIADHILEPGTCVDIVEGDRVIKRHDELDCQLWLQMIHRYYSARERGITDANFKIGILEQITPTQPSNQYNGNLAYAENKTLLEQAQAFIDSKKGESNE